jgi:HTH-type transcriptional regulator / antitoxin HigA
MSVTVPSSHRYFRLVRQFPLRPIRSESALARAVRMIDSLLGRNLLPDEQDYLDVLADLVICTPPYHN